MRRAFGIVLAVLVIWASFRYGLWDDGGYYGSGCYCHSSRTRVVHVHHYVIHHVSHSHR